MLYKVDIEYDRHLAEKNKEIEIAPDVYLSIRPDIIIHKREDDRHNLIAIEAKYDSLTKHDYLKLEKLLRPPYNYTFTVGVSYSPKTNHFRYSLLTLMEDVVLVIKTKLKKED